MAQQTGHTPLGGDRVPFEAAADPALRAECEVDLLRERLDAMAAISDGLGSRRRRRWRRKRLGDMLTELDAADATVPNQVSAEALRRWTKVVAQRRAASGLPRP